MDLDQLQAVIRKVCCIDDHDEMAAMLNFYHDLGVIVKHGHTVVLQAQWLIDLFKKLITVRPFDEAVSKVLCASAILCRDVTPHSTLFLFSYKSQLQNVQI